MASITQKFGFLQRNNSLESEMFAQYSDKRSSLIFFILFSLTNSLHPNHTSDNSTEEDEVSPKYAVEPRQQLSREEYERLFLDMLRGKPVGPSADTVVPAQYELDPGAITSINAAVPREAVFQIGVPAYFEAAAIAMSLLTNAIVDTYVVIARAARLRRLINYDLWTRAVFESTLYSPALQNLGKPTLLEVLPYKALPRPVIDAAMAQADNPVKLCPIVSEKYGVANGVNNRLWYFRDDFELNIEHWYWHLAYPLRIDPNGRPDRRGELFYYLHQSLLARHNAERLSNELPLTTPVPVSNNAIVEVAYYPYLSDMHTGKYWPSRPPNQRADYDGRQGENIPEFTQVVYAAIDAKELIRANGEVIRIDNFEGIDLLVDVIESNAYSVNAPKYGGIHNDGHVIIARLGNATANFWGVMAELSTSIRDPSFFQWHTFIQNIFLRHKLLLPPYSLNGGEFPLIWSGVYVKHLEVDEGIGSSPKKLHTFWSYKKFDIGHDINSLIGSGHVRGKMPVCLKHLQHKDFNYHIQITNAALQNKKATIRIFIAPRFDLVGKNRFGFEEQRQLFFVLDAFTLDLRPGLNFITRKSKDTTFTRPFSKSYAQLEREIQRGHVKKPQCGCGLPHHLLLPKGTKAGMVFDLFVMATNGEEDSDGNLGDQSTNFCTQPYHWCGRPGQKYPDKRPMGYPFDRIGPKLGMGRHVGSLEEYVGLIPNSNSIQVVITHIDQNANVNME